jgi:hypothetical protein
MAKTYVFAALGAVVLLAWLQCLLWCILFFIKPLPGWANLLFLTPVLLLTFGPLAVCVVYFRKKESESEAIWFWKNLVLAAYGGVVLCVVQLVPWAYFAYGVQYVYLGYTILLFLSCFVYLYMYLTQRPDVVNDEGAVFKDQLEIMDPEDIYDMQSSRCSTTIVTPVFGPDNGPNYQDDDDDNNDNDNDDEASIEEDKKLVPYQPYSSSSEDSIDPAPRQNGVHIPTVLSFT